MNFYDEYNILHDKPTARDGALTSENGPTFTGVEASLHYRNKTLTPRTAINYINCLQGLCRDGVWYTTPVTPDNEPSFSFDNFTGVVCLLLVCEKTLNQWLDEFETTFDGEALWTLGEVENALEKIKKYKKQIPWFHDQLDHPRDIAFTWWFKQPFVFWILLPITWIAMFVTCWQGHKTRNGDRIAKTDGKILALARACACDWHIVRRICAHLAQTTRFFTPLPRNNWHRTKKYYVQSGDKKILRRWSWESWYNICYDYFFHNEHPINVLVGKMEGEGKL